MADIGIVDLAHTADFRLGDVLVRPARRQVISDRGETEVLQPRVMQVLVALSAAQGAVVTREELAQSCWHGAIVGEDAVNRVISQLRRLTETLGEGSFRIETVPKVGYRIDNPARRCATPAAEALPVDAAEPANQPAEPARAPPRASRPGVLTGVAIVVFACLLGAGVGFWNGGLHWPGSASEGPHVAVGPFEVIGGGDAARQTARAVASEFLSDLSAQSVQTVAVTSAAAARRSVHLMLSGDVQQTQSEARVTLRLVDPQAGTILWSGEVVGDPTHLVALQRQASRKAVDMVTCGLDAFTPKAHLDDQARVLWLRTCDTWRQYTTLGQARDAMQVLMQRAPRFSGAYARYALATARMIPYGIPATSARAARDEARAAALHALELNPDEGDAYIALSVTEPATDWLAREQWLLRGLAHQPNSSDLISWQAYLLSTVGRTSEVVPLARRGVELDPHSSTKTTSLASWLYFAGESAEALKVEQYASLTWPQSPDVLDADFEFAIRRGDAPEVLRRLSNPQTRPVSMSDAEALLWPKIMAERHGSSGARLVLAKQIATLVERRQFNVFWGLLALHALDEDEESYDLMSKLSRTESDVAAPEDIATVLFQPEMANLRRQPRFMQLAANVGLTTYWLRSGQWPDFCSDPDLGYSCLVQARAAERARTQAGRNPASTSARVG